MHSPGFTHRAHLVYAIDALRAYHPYSHSHPRLWALGMAHAPLATVSSMHGRCIQDRDHKYWMEDP